MSYPEVLSKLEIEGPVDVVEEYPAIFKRYGAKVSVNGEERDLEDEDWLENIDKSVVVCHFENHTRAQRCADLEVDFDDTCCCVSLACVFFAYSDDAVWRDNEMQSCLLTECLKYTYDEVVAADKAAFQQVVKKAKTD